MIEINGSNSTELSMLELERLLLRSSLCPHYESS